MNTEGRVTRSRARTLASTGETPSLAALPDKTPATRTTRRRAAAAAAAEAEAAAPDAVAPTVLFEVPENAAAAEEAAPAEAVAEAVAQPVAAPAIEDAAATEEAVPEAEPVPVPVPAPEEPATEQPAAEEAPQHPDSPVSMQQAAVEEPVPATPAHSMPTSPAPPCPGATPTGLDLSSLPPLSPMLPAALVSKTPAATPMGGVPTHAEAAHVYDALHAAAEALGAPQEDAAQQAASAHQEEDADLVFRGFGSPVKADAGTPDSMPAQSVSIGPSIGAAAGYSPLGAGQMEDDDDEVNSGSTPNSQGDADVERELTLEEMMGTPLSLAMASEGEDSPTFVPASAAPTAPMSAAVEVRTVSKAHPNTPARQVVLEAEEQDFIMQAAEEEEEQQQQQQGEVAAAEPAAEQAQQKLQLQQDENEDVNMAAEEAEPEAEAKAPSPAPAKPKLSSKVVVPSPGYDPRSLRQLKREVYDRIAAKRAVQAATAPAFKAAASPTFKAAAVAVSQRRGSEAEEEQYEDEEYEGEGFYEYDEEEGEDFVIGTAGGNELVDALGALSLECGAHGPLRGLPTPAGKHIRFDDDGEAAVSPRQRVFLRGLPEPAGTHIRFDF